MLNKLSGCPQDLQFDNERRGIRRVAVVAFLATEEIG